MDRAQKAELVSALHDTFAEIGVVVVTRNLGLTVAQSTDLRSKMRDAGASYKVTKNRLAKIAVTGTAYEQLGNLLTGPTALATSPDPVAAAKVAVEFAKTNDKFEIVGGAMGETLLDVEGVKALASLPSLDELRATYRRLQPRSFRSSRRRPDSLRGSSMPMQPKTQPDFSILLKQMGPNAPKWRLVTWQTLMLS
jgi:large subunit ribosomal protein L10